MMYFQYHHYHFRFKFTMTGSLSASNYVVNDHYFLISIFSTRLSLNTLDYRNKIDGSRRLQNLETQSKLIKVTWMIKKAKTGTI